MTWTVEECVSVGVSGIRVVNTSCGRRVVEMSSEVELWKRVRKSSSEDHLRRPVRKTISDHLRWPPPWTTSADHLWTQVPTTSISRAKHTARCYPPIDLFLACCEPTGGSTLRWKKQTAGFLCSKAGACASGRVLSASRRVISVHWFIPTAPTDAAAPCFCSRKRLCYFGWPGSFVSPNLAQCAPTRYTKLEEEGLLCAVKRRGAEPDAGVIWRWCSGGWALVSRSTPFCGACGAVLDSAVLSLPHSPELTRLFLAPQSSTCKAHHRHMTRLRKVQL